MACARIIVVAAQPLVLAEQAPYVRPACRATRRLALDHVAIELRRPPHGLAGVVDDEVEPLARRAQVLAERLDARRVAQIEPEDLEPVAPDVEVGLPRRSAPRSRAGSAS